MRAARTLRRARHRAGLTQRELARRSDIPQPSVSRIERGLVAPSVETLERLLAACGMELEAVDRLGEGIDTTLIRDLRAVSPRQRLARGDAAARSIQRLLATARRQS